MALKFFKASHLTSKKKRASDQKVCGMKKGGSLFNGTMEATT